MPHAAERQPAEPDRLTFVGHSHLAAIERAARARGPSHAAHDAQTFVNLQDARFADFFRAEERGLRYSVNPRHSECVASGAVSHVFLALGGNHHNAFGLLSHPRPFDFVIEEAPELPLDPEREVVPSALVREALEQRVWPVIGRLRAVRAAARADVTQFESPPPIPSEPHVRKYLPPGQRPTPAWIRYKLWRVESAFMRAACRELGVRYVEAPTEAQDGDGFLAEHAWGDDPTHGNAWYGGCVLRQVNAILAGARHAVTP
jgi:hypothetical protein